MMFLQATFVHTVIPHTPQWFRSVIMACWANHAAQTSYVKSSITWITTLMVLPIT